MVYVNIDRLRRKLNQRLKLDSSQADFYNVAIVDELLLQDVIAEKENFVDMYLGMIYKLPLRNNQPVVNQIAEDLVMSDLIAYEYVNTQTASQDLTNFAVLTKKRAYNMLYQLLAGMGIPLPEADGVGFYLAQQFTRRLVLPGEIENLNPPPRIAVNNDILVGTIVEDKENDTMFHMIDKDQSYNPFSSDYLE